MDAGGWLLTERTCGLFRPCDERDAHAGGGNHDAGNHHSTGKPEQLRYETMDRR